MSDNEELKDKLSTAVQILRWELADMWGHVSCRSPRGDSFLIMPMRPPFDPELADDEILEYDFDGKRFPAGAIRRRKSFSSHHYFENVRIPVP